MSPHTFINRPPVVYRTSTPWWRRLARQAAITLAATGLVAFLVLGTTTLIAKLHATEAQLNQAHLAGMALGLNACGGR
jgi:anti-sigma-K factor RskA